MPTTKSAKKRLRQSEGNRVRNRSVKSSLKSQVKKVREAVADGNLSSAESDLKLAIKKLDQAGSKRVIHRNKAARTKSRLQKLLKGAKSPAAGS